MRAVGARQLLPPLVVVALVTYLAARLAYAALPALPLLAGVTLLVLAAAEVILAHGLRARIERRPGTRPVPPLVAARAVALAQASALAGAIMGGLWLGLLGYVLPRRVELAAAVEDTSAAVVGLVSAVALAGAALWLQRCCRIPPEDEDRPRERR